MRSSAAIQCSNTDNNPESTGSSHLDNETLSKHPSAAKDKSRLLPKLAILVDAVAIAFESLINEM
jgi:hypothetical protein